MIWLIGHKGMLGTEVHKLLIEAEAPHIASDLEVDITDINRLRSYVGDRSLSWVINCSAYTAVDRAEDEREAAFRINSEGVGNIALIAAEKKAKLIHISTDYVFDGSKEGAYLETDPPNPTGVYGASKYEGEKRIQATLASCFILRTAWLYGRSGNNFVHTMMRLFRERDEVRVVADQWGSPTLADDLARAILHLVSCDADRYGIYHFTNEGRTHWHAFAAAIYQAARERGLLEREVKITPITTDQYPTRARRPANSYMSKEKIRRVFGISIRPWQEALSELIEELTEGK
ncbi:MAG: dTDP-4-dehydrorhamnose reductase [Deltaproteobacteria bacterium]|nr:dTDP-4-dehydrorhamnose reductase [Deltaproteobacteria bacterium]